MPDSWMQYLCQIEQRLPEAWARDALRKASLERRREGFILRTHSLVAKQILEKFYFLIQEALSEATGERVDLQILADPRPRRRERTLFQEEPWIPEFSEPDPTMTFENFVVGENNHLTHAAALAVAQAPARTYNPLFIYGATGLGKTHLLCAIGNYLRLHHPALRVAYVTTDQFTDGFVNAIARKRVTDFRKAYEALDVLLLDDVQFLAGRTETQKALFNILNHMTQKKSQVVFTSDCPPKDLRSVEERLISRFMSGLIADIQPPEYELRVAILRHKAQSMGEQVPEEVVELIARLVVDNVRALQGALNRVLSYARFHEKPLTVQTAQEALRDLFSGASAPLTADRILEAVARRFEITREDLIGRSRTYTINQARHIAMYLLRTLTNRSYAEIGKILGGRDHSTVLHGVSRVEKLLAMDAELRREVEDLIRELRRPG